jgi:hypothetical protein
MCNERSPHRRHNFLRSAKSLGRRRRKGIYSVSFVVALAKGRGSFCHFEPGGIRARKEWKEPLVVMLSYLVVMV